jgi:hypothetical protein
LGQGGSSVGTEPGYIDREKVSEWCTAHTSCFVHGLRHTKCSCCFEIGKYWCAGPSPSRLPFALPSARFLLAPPRRRVVQWTALGQPLPVVGLS